MQLSSGGVEVGDWQPQRVHWQAHKLPPSSHLLEYIPGRDQLWPPQALAAGAPMSDNDSTA